MNYYLENEFVCDKAPYPDQASMTRPVETEGVVSKTGYIMTKIYSISTTDSITTIQFSKQPGLDDLIDAIDDVQRTTLRLWDFSKVGIDLTNQQVLKLAEHTILKFSLTSRSAILASDNLTFGLSRMWQSYCEDSETEKRVFRAKQDARDWLQSIPAIEKFQFSYSQNPNG